MFDSKKIANNIKRLRVELNLTQSEFADKLGVNIANIRDLEIMKVKPSIELIYKIREIFYISLDNLVSDNFSINYHEQAINPTDRLFIAYYPDVQVSAGGGIMNGYEGSEPFAIDKSLIDNPNTEVIINVIGESMEPTLKNGEKILVDINQNNISLKPDKIYVVLTDGAVVVKRYSGRQDALCIFSSDNKVFQPFTVDLANEDNKVIGIVKGIVYRKIN